MKQAFVRARRPEHKQQRREAILAAARDLAVESGVRDVSLGGVAAAVGPAKANVVRYCGTREEIYLERAAETWREWGAAATERLRDVHGTDGVATALVETLADRPLFCDLLSHTATTLEHNVSVAAARAFKLVMIEVAADLGREVARAHGGLTAREGFELAAAAATLAELYAQDPEIAAACPQFEPTLRRALAALAEGLPALR